MKVLLYGLFLVMNMSLLLFLNGNIILPNNPLPPFGKFLNPFCGVWSTGLEKETNDIILHSETLKAPVEIIYDDRRVPHIFAQNMEDALFAQGYVQAQNRLFQMEFVSMASAGSLSSVLGDKTLEIDREKRRRGMLFAAENAVKGWQQFPEFNTYMTAFKKGINAYISDLDPKDYPLEYKLLDFSPSEWTDVKSALIFKYMALTLAGRNDDIRYTNLRNTLGEEAFRFLYPETEENENPVIPDLGFLKGQEILSSSQNEDVYFKGKIQKAYYESRQGGVGSNSWGLSGMKTASGKTIFCNDPHLSLGLPSIWFEVHIHTPEFNAYGVSIPGMPGIMIGFNEDIAWGETNVGQDVEDLFLIEWADAARTKYMLDGAAREVEMRIETHTVKGGKTITDTIRYTTLGPVYHESTDKKHDLALRWLIHDMPDTPEFMVFVNAMRCKDYEQYLDVTSDFISPAQNFGFISKTGDIAMRINGRFPVKTGEDGRYIEFGNQSANDWQDYIPRDQNPQILNPERGFISSANQRSAPRDYPYYYTGKFEHFRNKTINNKLAAMEDITVDDMKKMQTDAWSSKAADVLPLFLNLLPESELKEHEKKTLEVLSQWDFQYRADKLAPVCFELFFSNFQRLTWDEILGLQQEMDVALPKPWRLIDLLRKDPENKYFDIESTSEKESAGDIIRLAFEEMSATMINKLNENPNLTWGSYRPLDIFHLIRLPALSEMGLAADGCPDVINAVGQSFGPSWRMIVHHDNSTDAYGVYPGGQSGNPSSKYYKNMVSDWLKGAYYPLRSVRSSDELSSFKSQSLRLIPKK